MEEIKRVKRETVFRGKVLEFCQDTMVTPDGHEAVWDIVLHNGAAAILPVRQDGKILMVKQFRGPFDRVTIEIPAGKKDKSAESTLACAVRELEEETGYRSDNVELLITLASAIAYSSEEIDIYIARDLIPTAQHLDEDEFLDVVAYSTDELKKMIFDGTIRDSKTIAAIMAYLVKYDI